MKVHSDGGYGSHCEFVYMDEDGNLFTACVIDFVVDSRGLGTVPLYLINLSEVEVKCVEFDPDDIYDCLGEL